MKQIFSEFSGVQPKSEGDTFTGTGDVKYHLGTSYDRPTATGKRVHLSLLANPSHLEVSKVAMTLQQQISACIAFILSPCISAQANSSTVAFARAFPLRA